MAQELFTLSTLGTLAGATAATAVVGNTLQSVFNIGAKWLSLAIAEIILVAVAFFNGSYEASVYFIAVLNGCLVYCSAVGLNTMTSSPAASTPVARSTTEAGLPIPAPPIRNRSFFSRWW